MNTYDVELQYRIEGIHQDHERISSIAVIKGAACAANAEFIAEMHLWEIAYDEGWADRLDIISSQATIR